MTHLYSAYDGRFNLFPGSAYNLLCSDSFDVADFINIDPPWPYDQKISGSGVGASDHFPVMSFVDIAADIEAARRICAPGGRGLLWSTNSQDPEIASWLQFTHKGKKVTANLCGWKWVSGGAWVKPVRGRGAEYLSPTPGSPGMGYHSRSSEAEPWSYLLPTAGELHEDVNLWATRGEALLPGFGDVLRKIADDALHSREWEDEEGVDRFRILLGDGPHRRADVPGCWTARALGHSQKPIGLLVKMIKGWCPPGGVVLDLYAGWGSCAEATLIAGEGRRYFGAEIHPPNFETIVSRVAMRMGQLRIEDGFAGTSP